jgi:hypothetical protein
MSAIRTSLAAGLALCATLLTAMPTSAAAAPCRSGYATGDWDLPTSSGGLGFIDGLLYQTSPSPGPFVAYSISGTLTDVPSPCLSCIEGKVDAILDDGFGPAPDYVVKGTYLGAWLTGKGEWSAYIYTPTGTTPVGKISGKFDDPPGSGTVGTFKADWEICP